MQTRIAGSADELAALVPDGATIAIAKDPGAPMALVAALVRRGVRRLHLVTVPTGGMAADVLIGAGAVATVETSGISLGEHGPAPRFVAAVRAGTIALRDATCPAVYAALQAGEKGQPFAALRGLIGSDLLAVRKDWTVIDNPFAPGDPVAVLPALRPDLALLHVALADSEGTVWAGHRHELRTLARAARRTLVTAERIVDGSLLADPLRAPMCLSGLYVDAVAEMPGGATPVGLPGADPAAPADPAAIAAYARAARDDAGFAAWLDAFLGAPAGAPARIPAEGALP